MKWSNKTYDDLIKKANTEKDPVQRMKTMAEAEKVLLTESPIVPLYWPTSNFAEHPWVKGILRATTGADIEWKWAYTEGRPGGDGVLNLNLGEEPPDMQSITSTDVVSFELLNATCEGLTRRTPDGTYPQGSGLAKSWTVSPDGTVYTFTLKDDIKWSNGDPVTAMDFEYAWKKVVDPREASQYNYMLFFIKGAEEVANIALPDKDKEPDKYAEAIKQIEDGLKNMGVVAKDAKTLEVTLTSPNAFFLSLCAFPTYFPVNQKYRESLGDKYATEASNMLYCGPFIMTEWSHGSKIVLKKNPNYWDAASVKLNQINFDMIKDINTPIIMYEANQLDTVGVPGDFIEKFKKDHPSELKQMAQATCWYLELNPKHPAFANSKFRRAISLGFDRQSFVDNVLKNFSQPATAYTPPSIHGIGTEVFIDKYVDQSARVPAKADLTAAEKLLKEACKELGYGVPKPPTKK